MGDVEKEVVGVKRGRSCGLDRGRGDVRERGEEVVGCAWWGVGKGKGGVQGWAWWGMEEWSDGGSGMAKGWAVSGWGENVLRAKVGR